VITTNNVFINIVFFSLFPASYLRKKNLQIYVRARDDISAFAAIVGMFLDVCLILVPSSSLVVH
jgi:hypothetical protein